MSPKTGVAESTTRLEEQRLLIRQLRKDLVQQYRARLLNSDEPPIRVMLSIVQSLERDCAARQFDDLATRLEIANRTIGDVDVRRISEREGEDGGPGDYRRLADELGIALPGETLHGYVATGRTYQWLRDQMVVEERELMATGFDPRIYDFGSVGNPVLRQWLADDMRQWGLPVTARHIALALGATDGIDKVLRGLALLAHGRSRSVGSVLVPAPVFNVPESQAVAYGYGLHKVTTRPEDGFKLTAAQLAQALADDPAVGIVYLNITTNPTTFAYSPEELAGLLDVLARHRQQGRTVYLLADLAYVGTGVPADDEARMRALVASPDVFDQLICVSSLSKTHTLTGERFGWVTFGDADLAARMIGSWISSVASMPGEWQLRFMTYHRLFQQNPQLIEKIRNLYGLRRKQLRAQLEHLNEQHRLFEQIYLDDDATIYNWSRLRAGEDCYSVLEKAGIAGLPGSLFGYSDEYIRFSVGYLPVTTD